jgi:hypothetical protein
MRISLIGDSVTRRGYPVRRWTGGREDEVIYTDYSEYGMWAEVRLRRQGWRFEVVRWDANVLDNCEVKALGAGLWEADAVWIGGDCAWAEEYDGKRVERR